VRKPDNVGHVLPAIVHGEDHQPRAHELPVARDDESTVTAAHAKAALGSIRGGRRRRWRAAAKPNVVAARLLLLLLLLAHRRAPRRNAVAQTRASIAVASQCCRRRRCRCRRRC
jgi:hypothetical protein